MIELRIERHLASLLSGLGGLAMPSIRVIQAPVFHGYSISLYVEFDTRPDLRALTAALASDLVDVRDADLEPPNNAGSVGQGGIAVGSIAPDRNHPSAFWFWVVADNFRLMAENGVAVVRSLLPAAVLGEAGMRRAAVRGAALAILLTMLCAGCGYRVAGRADLLPRNIHTIAIPAFGNATTRYRLTERMPAAITREFIARTRYRVVPDTDTADAVLQGSVVNYNSYPVVVRSDHRPCQHGAGQCLPGCHAPGTGHRDGAVLANAHGVSRALRDQRGPESLL